MTTARNVHNILNNCASVSFMDDAFEDVYIQI